MEEPERTDIFLIGTCHSFQIRTPRTTAATQELFKSLVQDASNQHSVRRIAEEMSDEALQNDGVTQTICAEVAAEKLGHKSCFVDPNSDERRQLRIENVDHIKPAIFHELHMQFPRGTSREDICREATKRTAADPRVRVSNEKRELEWICRLKAQNQFPVLLVCGSDHVHSFSELAKRIGLVVTVLHEDWHPI